MKLFEPQAFTARRDTQLQQSDALVRPVVRRALTRYPNGQWWTAIVNVAERIFRRTFTQEHGSNRHNALAAAVEAFRNDVEATLKKTKTPKPDIDTVYNITNWISTAAINAATQFAAKTETGLDMVQTWTTMHDSHVRPAHEKVEGQTVSISEPFTVDGVHLRYPGDPRAPIELWINCRCVTRPHVKVEGKAMTAATETEAPVEEADDSLEPAPIPWHGVLAPEGVFSGDKRRFAPDALRHRDLPLALNWQKVSDEAHKGSVQVGRIDSITRDNGLMKGEGVLFAIPETDEMLNLLMEMGKLGVSVDVDDATGEMDEEAQSLTFSDARICSAAVVGISAFPEAYIALGSWEDVATESFNCCEMAVSDKPWDGSAGRFTDEEWFRSTIIHTNNGSKVKGDNKLPILEPSGALSRAGVHAAAGRLGQTDAPANMKAAAKARLRSAYKELGEEPPSSLTAAAEDEAFGRGPGWVTNPTGTKRLWNYWVHGEGAAKIRWGQPGDFNRCRVQVGEEIGEGSPAKLKYLNQICAQWHHDAIGAWPGQEGGGKGNRGHHQIEPSMNLVASAAPVIPDREWFTDPHLVELSPVVINDEGRIFGHIAGWRTCHTGFPKVCITPPKNYSDYKWFHLGSVETTEGMVACGKITLGGGHASDKFGYIPAMHHYDDTSHVAADVVCGEDEFGIWVSGAVRSTLSDEDVKALRAAPPSGDWREIPHGSGVQELTLAHSVNDPGFPVPRIGIENGRQISLVAAGYVPPRPVGYVPAVDMATLASGVVDEMEARARNRARMNAVAAEFQGDLQERVSRLSDMTF